MLEYAECIECVRITGIRPLVIMLRLAMLVTITDHVCHNVRNCNLGNVGVSKMIRLAIFIT